MGRGRVVMKTRVNSLSPPAALELDTGDTGDTSDTSSANSFLFPLLAPAAASVLLPPRSLAGQYLV